MEKLEENIGYTFKNKQLLKKALTHTSYAYEHNLESNERREIDYDKNAAFTNQNVIKNKEYNTNKFFKTEKGAAKWLQEK